MRDFGVLKGADLVHVLATLVEEGALAGEEIQYIKAVNQELGRSVELFMQANHCLHAQASDYDYQLENVLYKKRLLERSQLEEIQHQIRQFPEQSVAQLILKSQWLPESELADVVAHLTELIAHQVLAWEATAIYLDKSRVKTGRLSGFGIAPQKLMSLDYFARNAEKNLPVLELMREQLGNPKMILRRQGEADKSRLSGHQAHVYRYVNNRNALRDIFQLSDLGYFDTSAALFQLMSWGYVSTGRLETPRHLRPPAAEASAATSRAEAEPAAPLPRPSSGSQSPLSEAEEKSRDKSAQPATPSASDPPVAPASPASSQRKGPGPAAEVAAKAIQAGEAPRPGQRQFLRRGRGAELLQILVSVMKTGYKTGRLVIDNQKQVVRADISFQEGEIVHAGTTASQVRFGDLLVKRGLLGPGQLREALEEQKYLKNVPLGEVLVRHDLLKVQEIPKLVLHQMECVIYEVLAWKDAKFYFEPEQLNFQQSVRVKAEFELEDGRLVAAEQQDEREVYNILAEADQNLPILLMIREQISNHMVPVLMPELASTLSSDQEQIVPLIDGQHSVYDILLASPLRYFDTYTALFQLYSTGDMQLQQGQQVYQRAEAAQQVVTPPPRHRAPSSEKTPEAPGQGRRPSLEYIMGPENAALMQQLRAGQYLEFRKSLHLILTLALQED